MTDFEIYQGEDAIPYFVINDSTGAPVDVSGISAATWVADPPSSTTPTIIKHLADMTTGVDPTLVGATVHNCIFIPILAADTGTTDDTGVFTHELRITLGGLQTVVYPAVGVTATFTVVPSLTWNPGTSPPAPRLEHEEPENKLRRVPTIKKVG